MPPKKTYNFYYDERLTDFGFSVDAYNSKHAYNLAYNDYGPQVQDMYYKEN